MKYLITLREAEEGGYTVEVLVLPGCISQGNTYQEAVSNIREAIVAYLQELEPVYHRTPERITSHVHICVLAYRLTRLTTEETGF